MNASDTHSNTSGDRQGNAVKNRKNNTMASICRIIHTSDLDLDTIVMAPEHDFLEPPLDLDVDKMPPLGNLENGYERVDVLKYGSQGTIFRTKDNFFGRQVAVKSLLNAGSESLKKDFLACAKLMGQLDHPAIIPVHNICCDQAGGVHLVMKFVDGKNLHEYLVKINSIYDALPARLIPSIERKSLVKRLGIFLRVCDAVSFAHGKNIMHLDLKPENIMVGFYNEVYVLDWGMAEAARSAYCAERSQSFSEYQSPEQVMRLKCDVRTDVYSMGLILYRLVFLKQPFTGTDEEISKKIRENDLDDYTHKYHVKVHEDLVKIIEKATALSPEDRYTSLADLAEDVHSLLMDEEVSVNPDNMLSRLGRIISRNRNKMALITILLCVVLMTTLGIYTIRELGRHAYERRRDAVLFQVHAKGMHSGMDFNNKIKQFTRSLYGLEKEAEAYLADSRAPRPSICYSYKATEKAETTPSGFEYVKTYRQKVSFREFVYKEPPGEKIENIEQYLNRLAPIKNSMRRMVLDSLAGVDSSSMTDSEQMLYATSVEKPPLSFLLISLKNGLHISYPYHDDYKESYDPRKRPWFMAAVENKEKKDVWSEPYIDNGALGDLVLTCTRKLYGADGQFAGCLAMDITLNSIVKLLATSGNKGDYVISKMLLDANGRIIADTSDLRPVKDTGEVKFKQFSEMGRLCECYGKSCGQMFYKEDNVKMILFHMHIDSLNWMYVERLDYDKMMKSLASK